MTFDIQEKPLPAEGLIFRSRVLAIGSAGRNIGDALKAKGLEPILADTDRHSLALRPDFKAIKLNRRDLGLTLSDEASDSAYGLSALIQRSEHLAVVAGLGGATACRVALSVMDMSKSLGRKVHGFFISPFDWEGDEKLKRSTFALEHFNKSSIDFTLYRNDLWNDASLTGVNVQDFFEEMDQQIACDVAAWVSDQL